MRERKVDREKQIKYMNKYKSYYVVNISWYIKEVIYFIFIQLIKRIIYLEYKTLDLESLSI